MGELKEIVTELRQLKEDVQVIERNYDAAWNALYSAGCVYCSYAPGGSDAGEFKCMDCRIKNLSKPRIFQFDYKMWSDADVG